MKKPILDKPRLKRKLKKSNDLDAVKESMSYQFPRDRAKVMLWGNSKPL